MKLPLLTLLLICHFPTLHSQITLEHTYTSSINGRIKLSMAGELYYRIYSQPSKPNSTFIDFHDGNHQFVKTQEIFLPPPVVPGSPFVNGLSSLFFDNDPGVEGIVRWTDSATFITRYSSFDDDSFLQGPTMALIPLQVVLSTGDKKMIASDTIYAIPSFVKEHTFPDGITQINHYNFESLGSKYYQLDPNGDLILSNPDYSQFAKFQTNLAAIHPTLWVVNMLGQYRINGDDKVEWLATNYKDNATTWRMFSDEELLSQITVPSSTVLFGTALTTSLAPAITEPKLFVSNSSFGPKKTYLFDLLSGNLEAEKDTALGFVITDKGKLVFFKLSQYKNATSFPIYDSDFSLWTTFPKAADSCLVFFPTEAVFDQNAFNKEIAVTYQFPGITNRRKMQVIRDNGDLLLNVDSCTAIPVLSRIPGLANKLLVNYYPTTSNALGCQVYSLPSFTSDTDEPSSGPPTLQFAVFPNPFSTELKLDLKGISAEKVQIALYNETGQCVMRLTTLTAGDVHAIPIQKDLPPGLYWIRLDAGSEYGWQKVVKI